MRFFKYLYYRLYTWNLKTWGENDGPQWNAAIGVSFMMILNIGILAAIIDIIGIDIIKKKVPKIELIILTLSVFLINYFYLVHKGKYKKIASEFKDESKSQRLRMTFVLWLYLFFSFGILIALAEIQRRFFI